MSDHTDLMTRLREHAENMYVDFLNDTADALEAQAKRIEELEAFIKKQYQQTDALQDRITELEAALEDERERCAKIAERFLSNNEPVRLTANSIAAAIRDRSNEHI